MKYLTGLASKLYLIFVLFTNWVSAQDITIADAITQEPLPNVSIYNQTKEQHTLTDSEGRASLSSFSQDDKILFQYLGYKPMTIDKSDIEEQNYVILLSVDSEELSEVVLSVARTPTKKNKIAEKVSIINTREITRNQPQTGAELLLLAPNIRIQKSQGGGGSPVLRGFEANRVLLVVDGVRMNNAIYRSGHLQNAITVDPNTIERVEVVYGSSSVGYGSDALGGVVHYFTKTPRINSSELIKNNFSSNYNSAQDSFITHFDTELSFKNWASYSSISFSKFGDLRMGRNRTHGYTNWGEVPFYSLNTESFYDPRPAVNDKPYIQRNSGYDQIDVLQKFAVKLPKEKLLTLNIQYSNSSNIPRFDRLTEYRNGSLRYAEWYYGPQKRLLTSSQLKIFPKKEFLYKGNLTLAYQNVEESRINRSYNTSVRSYQEENVQVWSFNGDFEAFRRDQINFAYGFELVGNDINSNAFSRRLILNGQRIVGLGAPRPNATRYPNAGSTYLSMAFYGNLKWDINPKVTLTAGTRYTETKLRAIWNEGNGQFPAWLLNSLSSTFTNVNVTNDAFTGSLSLTYRPSPQWQLNFLLSSGFRAPNIDDLGKIRENRGVLLVPNSLLKPEYANNIDLGVSFFTPNKKGAFALRFYNTSIRDYIGREFLLDYSTGTGYDAIQINSNIGNTYIRGASFEGKWNFNSYISLSSDFTFTDAGEIELFGPLPSILPFYGTSILEYKKNKISAQILHQFSSSKNPESYSYGGEDGLEETPIRRNASGELEFAGIPSWSIFSISGKYQWGKKITVRAGLENIFDIHYRTFASGISAPGRSLILGGSIEF